MLGCSCSVIVSIFLLLVVCFRSVARTMCATGQKLLRSLEPETADLAGYLNVSGIALARTPPQRRGRPIGCIVISIDDACVYGSLRGVS